MNRQGHERVNLWAGTEVVVETGICCYTKEKHEGKQVHSFSMSVGTPVDESKGHCAGNAKK